MQNQALNRCLIFIALIALFVIPELNNVHYDPQPQFWAEITAAWAIVGLFVFVCFRYEKISLPSVTLPLFIFGLYMIIQPRLVNVEFPGLNYVTAIEMLICIILAISINTLKEHIGLVSLVTDLCYALLIGAILQTLIGLIQYTGTYNHFGSLIFYDPSHPTTNIFGHFGQRNHYSHYICWATFGAIYLYHQRKIPNTFFYPLILWLSFSLTIAGSRSVFIYFGLALVISALYYIIKPNRAKRRWLKLVFISVIALFAFEFFYPLVHQAFASHNNINSGLERIVSDSATGRRGIEWEKAWIVFKEYPLWGYGWNEFAKQSVLLHHLFPNAAANDGLFTNCHNLILQLLAETGIVGTLIVVTGILLAVYRIVKCSITVETIVLLCMLSTTLAHSMNEYPLWYMYFLAGLVTFLSVDKPLFTIRSNLVCLISALPLAALVYSMIVNSIIFDNMVDYYDTPDDQASFNSQAHYLQNLVDHNVLWSYFAIYSLDNYIDVDNQMTNKLFDLKTQMSYTRRFCNFHPYPDTLLKEAKLAWNLGDKPSAYQLVDTAVLAFPVYKASYLDTLKAKKYNLLRATIK